MALGIAHDAQSTVAEKPDFLPGDKFSVARTKGSSTRKPSMASITPSTARLTPNTAVSDNDRARQQLTQLAANNAPADPRAADLARKVDTLVKNKFGGDYRKAFQHYAGGN